MSTIWSHTLVKNEERYLWFAVNSVIRSVDKAMIWDTGSTDNTVKIIHALCEKYPDKIIFREVGNVDIDAFTLIRQKMLEETSADWVVIVDGDEVWWDEKIAGIAELINMKGNVYETIVNRYRNIVGDIFHYQDEKAGKYSIDGLTGHLTIRAMNTKIPGLHFSKPHGQQGVFDNNKKLIQDREKNKRKLFNQVCYLHFTHMIRSCNISSDYLVPKREMKFKYELGNEFPLDYYYPETFFRPRPNIVDSPWVTRNKGYVYRSLMPTILKYYKRRLIRGTSGY